MIQSILFFTLGFLCAGFLALMVAPALWRRAVNITRKRIESSVPLTLSEIRADKDRMRAEFAMSTRRLEMSIKSLREKAAGQIVEINRKREELKQLSEERDEKNRVISELETLGAELRDELGESQDRRRQLGERLEEAGRLLEERALELEKLGRMYDDASYSASSRQIELVARETEVEKLSGDIATLRNQRKEADRQLRETVAENKSLRQNLRAESKKVSELELKLSRMVATLSDRDDKLDRREKELARLREQVKRHVASQKEYDARLLEAEEQKTRLEAELAEMSLSLSNLLSDASGGTADKVVEKLKSDRERQEARLTSLTRENHELRAELEAREQAGSSDSDEERRENEQLRSQINDLAAEVIGMTALLDAADSPVRQLVDSETPARPTNGAEDHVASLADRVRALQKAAAKAG